MICASGALTRFETPSNHKYVHHAMQDGMHDMVNQVGAVQGTGVIMARHWGDDFSGNNRPLKCGTCACQ